MDASNEAYPDVGTYLTALDEIDALLQDAEELPAMRLDEPQTTVVEIKSRRYIFLPDGLRARLGITSDDLVYVRFEHPDTEDHATAFLRVHNSKGRVRIPVGLYGYWDLKTGDFVKIHVTKGETEASTREHTPS